jgi:hypothetical protein
VGGGLKRWKEGLKKSGGWLNRFPGHRIKGNICLVKMMLMEFHPIRDMFLALLAGFLGFAARGQGLSLAGGLF